MPEPPVLLIEVACQHFATLFLCALCLLPPLWQPKNPPSRVNLGVWWPFLGRLQVRVLKSSGLPRGWVPHFLLDLLVRPQPAKKRTASLANDLSMSRSKVRRQFIKSIEIPKPFPNPLLSWLSTSQITQNTSLWHTFWNLSGFSSPPAFSHLARRSASSAMAARVWKSNLCAASWLLQTATITLDGCWWSENPAPLKINVPATQLVGGPVACNCPRPQVSLLENYCNGWDGPNCKWRTRFAPLIAIEKCKLQE